MHLYKQLENSMGVISTKIKNLQLHMEKESQYVYG